jgi:hypothetical protein
VFIREVQLVSGWALGIGGVGGSGQGIWVQGERGLCLLRADGTRVVAIYGIYIIGLFYRGVRDPW